MPWDFGEEDDPPVWHNHPIEKYKKRKYKKLIDTKMEFLVTRDEWGAAVPTATEKLRHHAPPFLKYKPAERANHSHFTHTDTAECATQEECGATLRALQAKHMAAGEPDILHSFMVGGDGKVYEGRGWDTMTNIPEDFYTFLTASMDIAAIGDFSKKKPPKVMVDTLKKLFDWGIANKKIECCFDKTYNYFLHNMYYGNCVPPDADCPEAYT